MTTFYEILEQKNYPSEVKSYLEELFKEVFCVLEPEFLEIETYFQPVFSLSPRKVIGHEAFSRPKQKTDILKLLAKAKTKGCLFEFDLYCRFIAVLSAWERGYKGESFLFLNIHPGILDKGIPPIGYLYKLLELLKIPANKIVLEITEYEYPQDYDKYLQTIFRFLIQGYLLALDDFGAGCLTYKTILEVIPHFVKLDKFFTRTLEIGDVVVEKIILHLKELCDDLNVYLIAEGVENGEILDKVKSLDIKYGQGYYLGKPSKELNLQK